MNFYVRGYKQPMIDSYEYPCFILVSNLWDDYGFKTTFQLQYYHERNERHVIEDVKIMDIDLDEDGNGNTILPTPFQNLNDRFASLGTCLEYYENFLILKNRYNLDIHKILHSLNDVACTPGLSGNFEDTSAFQNSLLRERQAKTAFLQGSRIVNEFQETSQISFRFSTQMKGADSPHVVDFKFNREVTLPKRTIAIVGKNGTGKTQFLSNLANTLSYANNKDIVDFKGKHKQSKLEEYELGQFDTPLGPPFGKIITLSYSMFDTFKRPKPSKRFSYIYCGLRNSEDIIDKEFLKSRHIESLKSINNNLRGEEWFYALNEIVDLRGLGYKIDESFHTIENINEIEKNNILSLSSGHSILIYTITELIANLSTNSLVLFDEPENHLHPNAISNLINSINRLMLAFRSYAIITTHSPIVIQEMPSTNVWIFEREENITTTRPLDIESFGENLTTITEHIFEKNEVKEGFKSRLKNLSENKTFEEILNLFESKLSLNAKIYLSSLYSNN